MRMHRCAAVMFVGLSLALSQGPAAAQSQPTTAIEGIRSELPQLPYYSVFDFIAFSYNKGVVTLQGYAYQGRLKIDAERAVKRASGVDQVVNKIEDLPASLMDDDLVVESSTTSPKIDVVGIHAVLDFISRGWSSMTATRLESCGSDDLSNDAVALAV